MTKVQQTFPEIRKRIDERLAEYIEQLTERIVKETSVEYVQDGATFLKELVTSGGKRVRGYALMQMYYTAGGVDEKAIIEAALSIELFHLFALVHDDVIDKATSRRGVTTLHHFTESWLRERNRHNDLHHIGDSQAVLWGDLLLAISQSKLQSSAFPALRRTRALSIFSRMFTEVIVGEMIDVDMATRKDVTEAELLEKTLLKTAYYTFIRPMQIGVALAGGNEKFYAFCQAFGEAFGMAFQIQDDLFDVTLSEEIMHKPVLNDVRSGEHTLFTQYIFTKGTSEQKKLLRRYFGSAMTAAEENAVRSLFIDSGAIAHGKHQMAHYFAQAEACVMTLPTSKRTPWLQLIELVKTRKS